MSNNQSVSQKIAKPWWWWVNPWLYISRRDRAYSDALDIIQELSVTSVPELNNSPDWMDEYVKSNLKSRGNESITVEYKNE